MSQKPFFWSNKNAKQVHCSQIAHAVYVGSLKNKTKQNKKNFIFSLQAMTQNKDNPL